MKNVTVIGGGLSGLVTSILLARKNVPVEVVEKKSYPFHRVCGEYISNETVPFLNAHRLFPTSFSPPAINNIMLTSTNGRSAVLPLDIGGFGISRYAFDHWLYIQALEAGVSFRLREEVLKVDFEDDQFTIHTDRGRMHADAVVGAYGKRSRMDVSIARAFIKKRSPYVGVKYHVRADHPEDQIALHNFEGGYCGLSKVESGISNLCYLVHRDQLKVAGSIKRLEEKVLFKNPYLRTIFGQSEFLFEQPETINEISFETKKAVEHHLLFCGDAAGMITPLCGNGMAIAIHSSKLLTDLLLAFCFGQLSRVELEDSYRVKWNAQFSRRLWTGRLIQRLFGSARASNVAVGLAKNLPFAASYLVSKTHGQPF